MAAAAPPPVTFFGAVFNPTNPTARSFFDHVGNFFAKQKGDDSILKLVIAILDGVGEVASRVKAEADTVSGIKAAREWASTARDAMAMLNIFRGIFPATMTKAKELYAAATQAAPWSKADFLKFGANAAGILGGVTYIFAFGVAKPLANIRKHIFSKLDASFFANGIADTCAYLFAVLHVATILESVFQIAHRFEILSDENRESTFRKIADGVMKLIGALLEFAGDLIRFIKPATPSWVYVPLNLGVAIVGIVRVWVDTA